MVTLRRQGHVAERACGWLPGPSSETVAENGMFVQASAEVATEVKGVWRELCMPWLKVLDFILWKPMIWGAENREIDTVYRFLFLLLFGFYFLKIHSAVVG